MSGRDRSACEGRERLRRSAAPLGVPAAAPYGSGVNEPLTVPEFT